MECPICKKSLDRTVLPPWPKKAKTRRGRDKGLCLECDKAIYPPDGDEYQWDRVQEALRRLGGSLVIGGKNWTQGARADVEGLRKALDEMNCTGAGRAAMLRDMEAAIDAAVRSAILNSVASGQYMRYKIVVTIENCVVEYTEVPTRSDFP